MLLGIENWQPRTWQAVGGYASTSPQGADLSGLGVDDLRKLIDREGLGVKKNVGGAGRRTLDDMRREMLGKAFVWAACFVPFLAPKSGVGQVAALKNDLEFPPRPG